MLTISINFHLIDTSINRFEFIFIGISSYSTFNRLLVSLLGYALYNVT